MVSHLQNRPQMHENGFTPVTHEPSGKSCVCFVFFTHAYAFMQRSREKWVFCNETFPPLKAGVIQIAVKYNQYPEQQF